jgi:hypothetical protein
VAHGKQGRMGIREQWRIPWGDREAEVASAMAATATRGGETVASGCGREGAQGRVVFGGEPEASTA